MSVMTGAAALTRPWQPAARRPRDRGEQTVARLLTQLGIEFGEEDRLLVTDESDGTFFGLCPDFRVAQTTRWEEQFIEVTRAIHRPRLQYKRQRIRGAEKAHGVQIILVMTERPQYVPKGITVLFLKDLEANPALLLEHLRPRHLHAVQPAA